MVADLAPLVSGFLGRCEQGFAGWRHETKEACKDQDQADEIIVSLTFPVDAGRVGGDALGAGLARDGPLAKIGFSQGGRPLQTGSGDLDGGISKAGYDRYFLATAAALTFVGVGALATFPLLAAVVAILALVLPLLGTVARPHAPAVLPTGAVPVALLIYGLCLWANGAWARDRPAALTVAAIFTLYASATVAVTALLARSDTALLRAMGAGFVVAMAALAACLAVEDVTGLGLRRLLASYLPFVLASHRHLVMADGWVTEMAPFLLNKNVSIFVLLFWPALLIARVLARSKIQRIALWCSVAIGVVATFGSRYDTGKIALVTGLAVFLAARAHARWTRNVVAAGWIAGAVLAVPIAHYAYRAGAHELPGLAFSWRERIVIWGHTAGLVGRAPWFGVGIETTRAEHLASSAPHQRSLRFEIPIDTNLHAHNAFLTAWYETGAVGVALLSTLVLALIGLISHQSAVARPYLYAAFVAVVVTATFSWSLWATWFMAATALVAMFGETARQIAVRG